MSACPQERQNSMSFFPGHLLNYYSRSCSKKGYTKKDSLFPLCFTVIFTEKVVHTECYINPAEFVG